MKLLYTTIAALFCGSAFAQTWVTDTVTMQPGYQNEIFYSLANDEQAAAEIRNWDLAFATNLFEVTVLANAVNGITVYKTPYAVTDFNAFDTSGYSSWQLLYNEFHDWSIGTLQHAADTANALDYGWGNYNTVTHLVEGTRVFLLKLDQTAGVSFRKFYVSQKDANGNWEFRIADLDGANDLTRNIDVSPYQQKHFVYYPIAPDEYLDREPDRTSWDLLFTRYVAPVGPGMFYPVTGVLTNKETEVAKADFVDVNTVQEVDYAGIYNSDISTIGYDWKTFNGASFDVQDSLVYFVKTQNNAVYKLRFTAFESTNGMFVFDKSQVVTSVSDVDAIFNTVAVYPNPASSHINVVVNATQTVNADLVVYNVLGQRVATQKATLSGLCKAAVETASLDAGVYTLSIVSNNRQLSAQRFVKQ